MSFGSLIRSAANQEKQLKLMCRGETGKLHPHSALRPYNNTLQNSLLQAKLTV